MENFDRPKVVVAVLALIAVAFGVYYGLSVFESKSGQIPLQSTQFSGNVSYVKGNYILVKGYFTVDGKSYVWPGTGARDVEVTITPETKIDATVMYAPTLAELASTSGAWNMSTVKKVEVAGSIAELASTTPLVFIEAGSNIFGQSKFSAQTISYTIIKDQEVSNNHALCEDSTGKYIGADACIKKFNLK